MDSEDITTTLSNEEWDAHIEDFLKVLLTTWRVILLLVVLIGIAGNTLVLYIICKHREMHTATNYYVANLAAADIIFLLVCVTPVAVTFHIIQLSQFACKIIEFITHVSVQATSLTLTVMTIDRYNIIVHAVRSRRTRTTRKALLVNVYIWTGSIFVQLPVFIMTDVNHYRCEVKVDSLAWSLVHHYFVVASTYLLPLLVIFGCYLGILFKVWQKTSRGTESAEAHHRSNYRKRRITRMVFIVVMLFALCWLPTNMHRLWRATDPNYDHIWTSNWKLSNTLVIFILVLSYSNSLINPFVYAFITTAFKKCAYKSLCSHWHTYETNVLTSNEMKTVSTHSTQRIARDSSQERPTSLS